MTRRPGPTFRGSVSRATKPSEAPVTPTSWTAPGAAGPGAAEPGAMAAPCAGEADGAGPPEVWAPALADAGGCPVSCTPSAAIACVTGWKNVVPPDRQSPLPPDVTPSAMPSENNGP